MPPEKRSSIIARFVGHRLAEARGELSQKDFAELVGISRTQYNAYERGNRIPSDDALERIAQHLGKAPDEILISREGAGASVECAESEAGGGMPQLEHSKYFLKEQSAEDYIAIPLLDQEAAAGYNGSAGGQGQHLFWVCGSHGDERRKLIAVKVTGDSMLPTIPDGAIVIIDLGHRDPQESTRPIWAIRTKDGRSVIIRRLQAIHDKPGFMVLSDNASAFPPEIAWSGVPNELVVGQVIAVWRELA